MHKHNAKNERIKRQYFAYLREAKRQSAYFTPCRARISPDAGPPFHVMPGQRFTHAGPPL